MTPGLELIELSDETTVGTFGEVLLVQFRGPTLPNCVQPMNRGRQAIAARHLRFSLLAVIEPSSPPPDQAARQALMRFFEASATTLDCLACAFGISGFRGAMVRTVASSVLDLMPRTRFGFPRHVVESVEEASSMVQRHAPKVDGLALCKAMRELQSLPAGRP
jgi:hypothetical protein